MPWLHGEVAEKTADCKAAFKRAWNAETAALIELRVDADAISPRTTLSVVRAAALKSKS